MLDAFGSDDVEISRKDDGSTVTSIDLAVERFLREPASVRNAVGVIVIATIAVVVGGGVLIRLLDPDEYADIWTGMWWSLQTVTTVGYGDFYPVTWWGRVVAVLLVCGGIAVVGVVTATVSSWVIERAAETVGDDTEPATRGQVRELAQQLAAVSAKLGDPPAR